MGEGDFDYDSFWKKTEKVEEEQKAREELRAMSRGVPRKGIKGRYIKPKNHVSRRQIKMSYLSGLKKEKEEL
jgi:hypothetical protein